MVAARSRSLIICLLTIALCAVPASALQDAPDPAWTADLGRGFPVVASISGGVVVSGKVGGTTYVTRYDSNGQELWSTSFTGFGAAPSAISVGPNQDIFIGNFGAQIFSFAGNGDLRGGVEAPNLISITAMDHSDDGALYVGGRASDGDAFVTRFGPDGTEDWTLSTTEWGDGSATIPALAGLADGAVAVLVDVYRRSDTRLVTGEPLRSVASVFSDDAELLWEIEGFWRVERETLRRFGEVDGTERTVDVVRHPDGGFLALGTRSRYSLTSSPDAVIQRVDATGNVLWTRELSNPSAADRAKSLVVEPDGRATVFAHTQSQDWMVGDTAHERLTRFSPHGAVLWTARLDDTVDREGHENAGGPGHQHFLTMLDYDVTVDESGASRAFRSATLEAIDTGELDATTVRCTSVSNHPFTDLSTGGREERDASCIYALGVTTGTSATQYTPDASVSRDQMAAFLARLYRRVTGASCGEFFSGIPFVDVSTTSFARDSVACIFALELTTGTSPTTYGPGQPVTREQMAAFLARFYRLVTGDACLGSRSPFTDVPATSFAAKDIGCIGALGITTGTSPTTYSPSDFVTRGQMASFLARLYRLLI